MHFHIVYCIDAHMKMDMLHEDPHDESMQLINKWPSMVNHYSGIKFSGYAPAKTLFLLLMYENNSVICPIHLQ